MLSRANRGDASIAYGILASSLAGHSQEAVSRMGHWAVSRDEIVVRGTTDICFVRSHVEALAGRPTVSPGSLSTRARWGSGYSRSSNFSGLVRSVSVHLRSEANPDLG